MIITFFGAAGHIGVPSLIEILKIPEIDKVKVLLERNYKRNRLVKKLARKYPGRVDISYGDIANIEDIESAIEGASMLFNLAGVIPPLSEKDPNKSYRANELGVKNIVEVIERHPEVKLVDVTSVALYGSRNEKNPYIRVGDPLFTGVLDFYTAHKVRGEFALLESKIPNFVIIRQTAMVYLDMLTANMGDGILFHTPFNNPIEWSTAEDTARLFASIIREDMVGHLTRDNFWGKIFNLGGGENSRVTGYETVQGGFSLFGGDIKDFYDPNYCVTRNFHCGYFLDGDKLNDLFHYRKENIHDYWNKIGKAHPEMKMARIVPKKLMKRFSIVSTMKDSNAPQYWYKHNDIARITAFYGSKEIYENQPTKWEDFKLWDANEAKTLKLVKQIDYGFDINKSDKDISLLDLQNVAKKHGGKLLSESFKTGDVYTKVEWENQDGERFFARPYTVLRGGHWWNALYNEYIWDFDRLAKKDKLYAQYWYDSHDKDENYIYYFDENNEARIK